MTQEAGAVPFQSSRRGEFWIVFPKEEAKNLKADGKIDRHIDPRVAGMVYQGIVWEALYAKCISKDKRYRNIELDEIVDQAMSLFFRAIGVSPNE